MNYVTERISKDRLRDLIPLFKAAFNQDKSVEELLEKYDTSFTGQSYVGFIAYAEESLQPAAYYGVFPLQVRLSGMIHLVAQSGDTMTHPTHQGKGLFTLLANKTYQLCNELGIEAVFGFPSASSYPGFVKKLKWKHDLNIETFTFIVPTPPLAIFSRLRFTRLLYSRWTEGVLKRYSSGNKFESIKSGDEEDGVLRTEDYWNYKLRNRKNRCVKMKGKNVILKIGTSLGVGDIHVDNEQDLFNVIAGLKRLAFLLGVVEIKFYLTPGSILSTLLRSKFSPKEGLAIGYLNLNPKVDLSRMKYTYFDFDTF